MLHFKIGKSPSKSKQQRYRFFKNPIDFNNAIACQNIHANLREVLFLKLKKIRIKTWFFVHGRELGKQGRRV